MESSRPLAVQDREPEFAGPPRIHARRLAVALVLSLLLPVGIALLADLTLGSWPWLTMGISLVCIPVATIVVGGMAVQEMNRIVRLVAPEPPPAAIVEGAPTTGQNDEFVAASSHNFEAG